MNTINIERQTSRQSPEGYGLRLELRFFVFVILNHFYSLYFLLTSHSFLLATFFLIRRHRKRRRRSVDIIWEKWIRSTDDGYTELDG